MTVRHSRRAYRNDGVLWLHAGIALWGLKVKVEGVVMLIWRCQCGGADDADCLQ
jgi:hypothetical protein